MPDRLVRLAGILALYAAAVGGAEMRIPYTADAGSCHRNLKQVPGLGPGLEQMIAVARRAGSLEGRLRDVQDLRIRVVKEYRALPTRSESMREESLFVCAADDVLEAMFSAEAETLHALPASERSRRANLVLRLLRSLSLDPQWNDYARARIAVRIRQESAR